MNTIASTKTEDKKAKTTTYTFETNGEHFTAILTGGKKPTLEILHKETSLGTVTEQTVKSEFVANPDSSPVKITAWMEGGGGGITSWIIPWKSGSTSVGIEVDGVAVQDTTTDPEMNIKSGRGGLWFLAFIFALKIIIGLFTGSVGSIIYVIPLAIVVIAALKYAKWTKFALYAGLILSVLEAIEYLIGAFGSVSIITIIIWMGIRASAFFMILNAFQWWRKINAGEKAVTSPET